MVETKNESQVLGLRLYISGQTPRAIRAIENPRELVRNTWLGNTRLK